MKVRISKEELQKRFPHLNFGTLIDTVLEGEKADDKRSLAQNNALHKDYELIATSLNNAGLDMKKVLKENVEIPWTTISVKEYLFKPIMKSLLGIESTTELKKLDGGINQIHEVLLRHLGQKFRIEYIEFPHKEKEDTKSEIDYPDDNNNPDDIPF
jgi:hypothetical protein